VVVVSSVYDMLLSDPANAATLMDNAGLNPLESSLILSNAAALKSLRNSADFTTGVLDAGTAIAPGQLIDRGGEWYLVAKVLNLSAVTLAPFIPVRVQLQHLLPPFAGTRGVGGATVTIRMVVREDKESQDTTTARDRLDGLVPAGMAVEIGDLYTYGLWVYRVDDVQPAAIDGHQYGQDVHMTKYGPASGNAAQYMLINATVSVSRNGQHSVPAYTNRRVGLRYPSTDEQIAAGMGALDPAHIVDAPDADYKRGDVVTIVALDGSTAAPDPAQYRVGRVTRQPDPLGLVDVQLIGGPS